jgi:hypothetical protein
MSFRVLPEPQSSEIDKRLVSLAPHFAGRGRGEGLLKQTLKKRYAR